MPEETKLSLTTENKKLKALIFTLQHCLTVEDAGPEARVLNCIQFIRANYTEEEVNNFTEPVILHNYYFDEDGNMRHILGDIQFRSEDD